MIYTTKIFKHQVVLLAFLFCSLSLFAQEKVTVEGNLFSAKDRSPLKGIQVEAVGETGASASTDEDGEFKIEVSSTNVKLRFSYPGYSAQEAYIPTGKMVVYMYAEGESVTEQVVPLAYSQERAKNLSQAAEMLTVSPEEASSVNSFEELLYKSGAKVTRTSGTPGEGAKVNIRGYSSVFANVKPIVILDGLILENFSFENGAINGLYHNSLFNIDPRDVESITILKDASATAIYGARGANGVIIVNTNAVGIGETSIGITAFGGVNLKRTETIPVLSSMDDTKSYLQGQMYGSGLTTDQINAKYPYFLEDESDPNYNLYNGQTDWQDQVFEMGKNMGFHVNMKGGDEIAKYYFAGGYIRNEGNITNTVTNRYNLKLNALVEISSRVKASANMGFSYSDGDYLEQGDVVSTNPILASQVKMPFMNTHIINEEGVQLPVTSDQDEMGFSNPYDVINNTDAVRTMYDFTGKVNFEFLISSALKANVLAGTQIDKVRDGVFLPDWGVGSNGEFGTEQMVKQYSGRTENIYGEANLKYNRTFNNVNNFDGVVGFRVGFFDVNSIYAAGRNTASDDFKNLSGTTGRQERDGYHQLWNDYAYFGGLNYNYKEKYFVNGSFSLDASSRFGEESSSTLGAPSVWSSAIGLAWNVANEDLLSDCKNLDLLKIRASIGSTANSGIGAYSADHYYVAAQYYSTSGLVRGGIPNEGLHAEKNQKSNLGLDLSMFQNRLVISADLYQHTTKDMLSYTVPPVEYGYDEYWQNQGELKTNGYEIGAQFTPFDKKVKWTFGGTIGSYKMEMSGVEDGSFIMDVANGQKIFSNGEAPGLFYGYETDGVIESTSRAESLALTYQGVPLEAGDMLFVDRNQNGEIDEDDRMAIGDPTPDFYGSITNTLTYKKLSFEAVGTFVQGNDVYNYPRRVLESMSGFENQSTAVLRRWQTDGQVTDIPKATFGDPMQNARFSDRWIEDGSYFRLSRLTLSLDISQWLNISEKATIYASGLNLFTITDYLGFDPEFSYSHSMAWDGVDYGKVPQYSTVMVGFKIEL